MKRLLILSLILIFPIFNSSVFAQLDRYDWSFKFGWGLPSFRHTGDTKEWIEKGSGSEIILGSLGYKYVHLNLSYKYFNGLVSDNVNIFEGYQFPITATYRQVFMNLSLSYEYELIRRIYLEPQIGWVRTHLTSNVVDNNGDEIELNKADGLTIGTNLTKYIKIMKKGYLGVFVNINYNMIDYKAISNDLGGNTFGYGFGFVIKGTN
jgi:hypothetical protein